MRILTIAFVFFLVGCAVSPMPEGHYQNISKFQAELRKCFHEDAISPDIFGVGAKAIVYTLSTWDYDFERYNTLEENHSKQFQVTDEACKDVTEAALFMSSIVEVRISERNAQTIGQQEVIDSLNGMASDLNRAAELHRYNANQFNENTQYNWSHESQEKKPLYEHQSNPANNLDYTQTFQRSEKSASGRTVCIYSLGATLILPYGQSSCPITYR